MRRLVLITGSGEITKKGDRVSIRTNGKAANIPLRYIEAVIAMGTVGISGSAVNLLTSSGVPVFFLTRYGKPKGFIGPFPARSSRRLAQYRAFEQKRSIVAKKIVMMKLDKIEKTYDFDFTDLKRNLQRSSDLDSMRGIEGTASRLMFEEFSKRIKSKKLSFKGRAYHPPPDPVNALLSLSYSLAYCMALPVVISLGFDPYIAFLHSGRGTHMAFCSDVIEPVRPLITKFVEEAITLGRFSKKHFEKDGKGYFLKKEGAVRFMEMFEINKDRIILGIKESLISLAEVIS